MRIAHASTFRSLFLALFLFLAGCGYGGSSGSDFSLHTTTQAAAPSAAIVVAGDWIVYLASEGFTGPAGTNLNSDADTLDNVAFSVNMRTRVETNLGVAARGAVIVGDEIYLVVAESEDGVDWDGGGLTDIVLLHWSLSAGVVAFVDTLDLAFAGELPHSIDGRLYYSTATAPVGVDETSLRYLDPSAPTTPVTVLNEIGGGVLRVHLMADSHGLLFCFLDENDDGLDHNNGVLFPDGDVTDGHVLALLDATDPAARLKNTELAVADESSPVAAKVLAAHDWLVAFLVDEAAQGATNLNDQALFSQPLVPDSCLAAPDTDASDEILFYLTFSTFLTGASTPVDTGLAGQDRVLAFTGFVATISPEGASNCDLNEDLDSADEIARWVATTAPVTPERDPALLHALATATGGGSKGLAVLDDRLIAVVDEAADSQNLDGKAQDHDLVGWIDPAAASPVWHFAHQSSSNRSFGTGVFDSNGVSEPFAGTSWMAPEQIGDRLPITFLEEVPGTNPNISSLNANLNCNLFLKDSDKTDALPVWADFEGSILDFDGMGYAVDKNNPGIEIAGSFAFFRVSEADDNHDYNNDGVANDVVLFRNPLTTCGPVPMATSSSIAGLVITTDRANGAAFLSSETQAGIDFNLDGDSNDLVVRYFRF